MHIICGRNYLKTINSAQFINSVTICVNASRYPDESTDEMMNSANGGDEENGEICRRIIERPSPAAACTHRSTVQTQSKPMATTSHALVAYKYSDLVIKLFNCSICWYMSADWCRMLWLTMSNVGPMHARIHLDALSASSTLLLYRILQFSQFVSTSLCAVHRVRNAAFATH